MIDAHPVLKLMQQHLIANWEGYMALFSAICIASVCMMPEKIPSSFQDWWTWLRNTLQTAIPAARHHPNPPTDPPNGQTK